MHLKFEFMEILINKGQLFEKYCIIFLKIKILHQSLFLLKHIKVVLADSHEIPRVSYYFGY